MSDETPTPEAAPAPELAVVEATEAPKEAPAEQAVAQQALQALMAQEAASRKAADEVKHLKRYESLEGASPADLAKFAGISLQDLQKSMIDNTKPESQFETQITDLQQKFRAMEQAKVDQESKTVRENARSLVHTYIDSSKDFPIIQKLGFQDVVFQRVLQAQEDGKSLSETVAASQVEAELKEQITKAMDLGIFKPTAKSEEKTTPSTLTNSSSSETAAPKATKATAIGTFDSADEFAALLRQLSK